MTRQPPLINQKGNTMLTEERSETVLNVIHAVYDAWTNNDADEFAALYTEDATVVQPGIFKTNREVVRTTMAAGFAGPLKGSRVHDEPQSVRFLGPDVAIVITEGSVIMANDAELPLVRATWVLTQQDGQWLVAAYQNSPAN
jgi:uncharacterized protein (TIGR02246 family)